MNKITEFDKKNLSQLRWEIDFALANIGEKYGVKITTGTARFTDSTATFKLEAAVIRNGKAVSREMETLEMYLGLLGLTEEHLEMVFKIGTSDKLFKLSGYNPRKSKNPVMLNLVGTDKTYCCSESAMRKALGIAPQSQYGAI